LNSEPTLLIQCNKFEIWIHLYWT